MRVQDLEILANRNLRSFELFGEFRNQDSALMRQQIENGSASLFVKHGKSKTRDRIGAQLTSKCRLSFYSVLFRLSTGNLASFFSAA
jgi:hypothetical protein